MNSASFEALYSGFSRMHVQRTWDAILNAPVLLEDVERIEVIHGANSLLPNRYLQNIVHANLTNTTDVNATANTTTTAVNPIWIIRLRLRSAAFRS